MAANGRETGNGSTPLHQPALPPLLTTYGSISIYSVHKLTLRTQKYIPREPCPLSR